MPDIEPGRETSAIDGGPPAEPPRQIGEAGLAAIFNEFRTALDEQLGSGDLDTRYHLGIAYREMGLLDEAIAEFRLAAEDPGRAFECSSLLALCYMERGSCSEAAAWLERGLEAPGRTPEEHRGLRYQLALAYEAGGERKKALDQLSRIAEHGAFRDVDSRIRRLRAERA